METKVEFKFNNYDEFRSFIKSEISNILPRKYMKNRVVKFTTNYIKSEGKLECISFIDARGIFDETKTQVPTLAIKHLYIMYQRKGFNSVIENIKSALDDVSYDASDFENIKDSIIYEVCKTEGNEEFLKNVPHREIFDLSLYYNVILSDKKSDSGNVVSGCLLDYKYMNHLGKTEPELFDIATENCYKTKKIIPIFDSLIDNIISDYDIEKKIFYKAYLSNVYVVTSKLGIDGLALMTNLKVLKELSEEVEDDFFIMPLDTQVFSIYPYSTSKNKEFLNGLRKFLIKLSEISKESQINSLYLYKRSENNIFKYND